MSALARYFRHSGKQVAGYDRSPTLLTSELENEGIPIHFQDDTNLIPNAFKAADTHLLVIYTPAIPATHQELKFYFNPDRPANWQVLKRSEVLGKLSEGHFTIAVGGTHGKTTTTSMLAHILKEAGVNTTAFVGGIMTQYNSNLLLPERPQEPSVMVVEADEFDRSFLRLSPNIALITAAEPDHLDIYGQAEQVTEAFRLFAGKTTDEGLVILTTNAYNQAFKYTDLKQNVKITGTADYVHASEVYTEEGCFVFHLSDRQGQLLSEPVRLQMPGFHNVENALMAAAAAMEAGVDAEKVRAALSSYKGVKRRFEYLVRTPERVFIDDYAHHPTEIAALLHSVRALYPGKHLTAIFQPHLFTRTRDFADGFAESLSIADRLLLLPIYPARELPIEGVRSEMLLEKATIADKRLVPDAELLATLSAMTDLEVVCLIGAGDIDRFASPLAALLDTGHSNTTDHMTKIIQA